MEETKKNQDVYKHLKIDGLSICSAEDDHSYLALLKETDGDRIIPVLMERHDTMLLVVKNKSYKRTNPFDLSEVMFNAFRSFSIRLCEVRICAVRGGVTYCHLICEQNGQKKIISNCLASNGLLLAVTFRCPITIHEELLQMQYMREVSDGNYSMPVNSVGNKTLTEALKNAIETENYELAAMLRDELKRRK